ncbi:MAG TPA: serine/threonine-protein kinase, partial [Candidatus Angelobacter sp.]|nr:serine/threonine-protein kinase [Candidatus Angelobacter sp.]
MDDPAETRILTPKQSDAAPFLPGTLVGGRYRIVALVGRGGMGEVYRADDLKIGQPVALKFLPADLERHPDRLQRLFGEVRIARQVAHPNVCRVYDVGEFDGHSFITMEYVDGEDLAALLRRIGRLPQEKAVDLARQIAAGLAAAHDQGIIHRDLKPANVMLDGRGRAKVTDFGLAVAAEAVRGQEAKSGTPGYMAPEQIEGSAITPRTDVYALGLLLHEMSTGRTPKAGDTPRSGINPSVDALILRCLEEDPTQRPASAVEFLHALPGGDSLDAALRAGETPSPEMVAAAGQDRVLSAGKAWGFFGLALLVTAAAMLAGVKAVGLDTVPMTKSPEVLSERAREITRTLGVDVPPRSTAWWVGTADGYATWLRSHPQTLALASTRPAAVRFAYRESPVPILPWRRESPSRGDPPMTHTGESFVSLDLAGNLLDFIHLGRQLGPPDTVQAAPTDWSTLLSLTGISSSELRAVPPIWTPDVPSDARAAWVVTGGPTPLRIEAASWKGKPVWFRTIEPWERAERDTRDPSANPIGLAVFVGVVVSVFVGMAFMARYNLRVGRGDMRGATRVAAAVLLAYALTSALFFRWELEPAHIWNFLQGIPYFPVLVIWVVYLGVEPFLRRRWPHRLIAWTRLLEGKWMDPLVGRETLVGLLAGAAGSLLSGWLPAIVERHADADSLLSYLFPMG